VSCAEVDEAFTLQDATLHKGTLCLLLQDFNSFGIRTLEVGKSERFQSTRKQLSTLMSDEDPLKKENAHMLNAQNVFREADDLSSTKESDNSSVTSFKDEIYNK